MDPETERLIQQARDEERRKLREILPPGTYRLWSPVSNEARDRRKRHDWTAAYAFPTGRYFVEEDGERGLHITHEGMHGRLHVVLKQGEISTTRDGHEVPLRRLIGRLYPDDSSGARLAFIEHHCPVRWRDVLAALIDSGDVSVDAVESAAQMQINRDFE